MKKKIGLPACQGGGQSSDVLTLYERRKYYTSRVLPGFPGDLQHWLKLRGGNIIQIYYYMPNFSPIEQLEAEIQSFLPNFDHIFGPSSGTIGPIKKKFKLCNLLICAGYISKFQHPRSKIVGGVWQQRNKMAPLI